MKDQLQYTLQSLKNRQSIQDTGQKREWMQSQMQLCRTLLIERLA